MDGNSTPHAIHECEANQAGSFSIPMKQPLDYERQIERMEARGLSVGDRSDAISKLSDANYYRLRGYALAYEQNGEFYPGTTFDALWDTYQLDIELRSLVWSLIEPIEIKARTSFAYHMACAHGPVSHRDPSLFRDAREHSKSIKSLEREIERAEREKSPCVLHNMKKYGDLPIWAAVEIMSMGTLSRLYGNLDATRCDAVKAISSDFNVKPYLLRSWLRHLTYVRNICAHHGRLYNRVMTTRPALMKADSRFDGSKQFPTMVVLNRLYERLWPRQRGNELERLSLVIADHPRVSLKPMGFPDNWRDILHI